MSWPVMMLETMRPAMRGVISRPEFVAGMPRTPWYTRPTKRIAPNIAKPSRKTADGVVQVEAPAPRPVVGQVPADDRADDRGDAEDPGEDALEPRTLGG